MNIALILSGGVGTRVGKGIPKQYIKVGGRPVIFYCIERLLTHAQVDAVWIAADEKWHELIRECMTEGAKAEKFRGFCAPGENRQLSILHGLKEIRAYASDQDLVLIHDAARPLLSEKQITECLMAAEGHDGVIPVLPMKDTVYLSADGQTITSLLERNRIFAGQAPEVFRLGAYYEANCKLLPEKILTIHGSTEPAVMAGMDIVMIPGDEGNYKITTQDDLKLFCRRIERS